MTVESTAGMPDAVNAPVGAVTPDTVSGVVPVLVKLTDRVLVRPTGTVPKSTVDRFAWKPAWAPVPFRLAVTVLESVVTVSAPMAAPTAVGEKVTGSDSVWPAVSETGRVPGETVNGAGTVTADTVTAVAAVMVTVADAVEPTFTAPKSSGAAVSGAGTGAPKPNTCPSLVPT